MHKNELWLWNDSGLKEVLLSGFETSSSNDRSNLHIASLTSQSNSQHQSLLVASMRRNLLPKALFLCWGKLFFQGFHWNHILENNVDQRWRWQTLAQNKWFPALVQKPVSLLGIKKVEPNEHLSEVGMPPFLLNTGFTQTCTNVKPEFQRDRFVPTMPVPELTGRMRKLLQVNHTIKKSVKQFLLYSLQYMWYFVFAANGLRNPERSHPHCAAELCWRQKHGLTDSRERPCDQNKKHAFIWPATAAAASIWFDLCSSPMRDLTRLVLQTAFHTSDAAVFPAVSNLKQKVRSGRGTVKLLH